MHERSFRIVNNSFESTYEELLSHNCFFYSWPKYIHCLASGKVANDLSVGDFKNLFDFKDQYYLHILFVNTELKGDIWLGILVP